MSIYTSILVTKKCGGPHFGYMYYTSRIYCIQYFIYFNIIILNSKSYNLYIREYVYFLNLYKA